MRLVILAVEDADEGALDALRQRAALYAAYDVSAEDVPRFVARLRAGAGEPVGHALLARFTGPAAPGAATEAPADELACLTRREREVLREIAAGARTRDIAATLAISEHTVNFHLRNIFAKLRLRTRPQAVAWALERGLRARSRPE